MMNRLALLHQQLKKVIGSRSLPHLSIQDQTFTVIDGENKHNVANMDKENGNMLYVDVHIIDASMFMSKIYYVGSYDRDADATAPTCYSNDGFRPASDVNEPQSDFCAQCQHNAWGSRMTEAGKKGKACNDAWKVAVIVPEHKNDKVLQMRVPPASLQNWLAYTGQFNDYDHPGEDRKMNVADVLTRVFFEKQGVINFMALEVLTPGGEELQIAAQLTENKSTDIFIGMDNISSEKNEEILMLSAPSTAPQLTHQKPEPKGIVQFKGRTKTQVAEEIEEEEETEEVETAPAPKSKASNVLLPSEMRTKKMGQSTPQFKKQETTTAKPGISESTRDKLRGLMNATTK